MAPEHRAHDAAGQPPYFGWDWRCLSLHNNVLAAEPCLPVVNGVQRVLYLGRQAGAGHGIAEFVLPIGQEATQHGHDLGAGHLGRRGPSIGVEGTDVIVFSTEPASLEECPPLAGGNRRGASTVTAGEGQYPLYLPGIGLVPDCLSADHAEGIFRDRGRGANTDRNAKIDTKEQCRNNSAQSRNRFQRKTAKTQ